MRTFEQIKSSGYISAEEMEREGIEPMEFTCIRFLDAHTDRRWFMRDHEIVGYVQALSSDSEPCEPEEVLRQVRASFGDDVTFLTIGKPIAR